MIGRQSQKKLQGESFYDPNLDEVSYTLRLALERDDQRQLVEGRGRGRSGAHPTCASRDAIEETVLDLYTYL
jgi:hypothetical protein